MAEAFNAAGAAVATLEYAAARSHAARVVREVRSAVAWLYRNAAAYGVDPARIYVSGSSAGGHLAGMLAAPDWQARYGVPDDVIKGTLALSGLFDLRPLCDISVNDWLRLTPEQARLQSPIFHLPAQAGPMLLAVGGLERRVSRIRPMPMRPPGAPPAYRPRASPRRSAITSIWSMSWRIRTAI